MFSIHYLAYCIDRHEAEKDIYIYLNVVPTEKSS